MPPLRFITITLLVATLGGCGGGGAKVETQTAVTTVGQELQDLDRAYRQGLLTESEYNKQRKKILNR